jgi:arylformamidase
MPQSNPARFVTAFGGQESEEFRRQTELIADAWKPNHVVDVALPDANHLTICDAFGTPGHALQQETVKLIEATA